MERAQLRKSKSSSGLEGFERYRTASRFSSNFRGYNDGSTGDDKVEVGQRSSRRATERPMAKSLADKMYKEVESRRRSLRDIARLMRLQALPSLWNVRQQKKRLSDSYGQNNVSTNIEPNRQLYDGRSNRRSSMKQQEFNDSHEDLEASYFADQRCSSRFRASSMLTKSEMALIPQKLDAKHLSGNKTTNEMLEYRKKLDGTLDMLDSKEPDSLFLSRLHDHQANPRSSFDIRTAVLNQSSCAKYDNDTKGKYKMTSHPEHEDGLLLEQNRYILCTSCRTSDIQLEKKNRRNINSRRIVVLKPDQKNTQNAAAYRLSPYHSLGYVRGAEESSSGGKDSYCDGESSRPVYDEARKLAREITRRIRDACEKNEDASYSGLREHLINEILYNARQSDSFNIESEMLCSSSRNSFVDDNKWCRFPSSRFPNREGKKRLSERWKMTHRYQDLEIVSVPSTLGRMLGIPDGQTRPKNYPPKDIDRSSTRIGGSTNEIRRTSSRPSSLPPKGGRSTQENARHDVLAEEKYLMPEVANISFSSPGSKSRSKKPLPCPPIYITEKDSSLEASFEIEMEPNVKDLSAQHRMFQMAEKDDCSGSLVSDIMIAGHGITTSSSESFPLDPEHSLADNESSAAHDQGNSCLQGPPEEGSPSLKSLGAEPISSESSKDADHASPVSVLKVPSVEDASSSSGCFERVRAELNELRMQLQLLRMGFGTYDDISTLVPINKYILHSSPTAQDWEVLYTLDVLIHSGLQDFCSDMCKMMWFSPDCPLDPSLFDNLETKYSEETTGSRLERVLLFDKINFALFEIFEKYFDSRPWVMPKSARLRSTWPKERVQDALEKLIAQESANGQVTERILDREMHWTDSAQEIDLMGSDIEELLIDDMITEFLCELSC